MIKITFLAEHPELSPILAQWFRAQWPDYFANRSLAEITQGFYSEANRHDLPIRLIAFVDDQLAGTIVLREKAVEVLSDFTPGLGGLFVVEPFRHLGIGTELVRAGINVADDLNYACIYAGTVAARSLLERLGWELVGWEQIHGQERLGLYSFTLKTDCSGHQPSR